MKMIIIKMLKLIRREAEKGGDRPSSKGLFEQKVPKEFERKGKGK